MKACMHLWDFQMWYNNLLSKLNEIRIPNQKECNIKLFKVKLLGFLSKCREEIKPIEATFKVASLIWKKSCNCQEAHKISGITLGSNVKDEFLLPVCILHDILVFSWNLTNSLHTQHKSASQKLLTFIGRKWFTLSFNFFTPGNLGYEKRDFSYGKWFFKWEISQVCCKKRLWSHTE